MQNKHIFTCAQILGPNLLYKSVVNVVILVFIYFQGFFFSSCHESVLVRELLEASESCL